jgi:hypothetical protein
LPRRHSPPRRNGVFFPAIREFTGKKSHPSKLCPPKILTYQVLISAPDGLQTPGSGKIRQIVDDTTDFDGANVRLDFVAKMAAR